MKNYENRPLPEVHTTLEYDSVDYKEEPITVRIYSSQYNASVVKLTHAEAVFLANLLQAKVKEQGGLQ